MDRILVTGGDGYIGSRLVPALRDAGRTVDVVDIGWFSDGDGPAHQVVDLAPYDVVVHLAGHSSVAMCDADPDGAWDNNVDGFRALLQRLGADQWLIYASSGSVYGDIGRPASESDVGLSTVKQYDLTKVVGDVIASQAIADGRNVIGLRFGTVNGISPHTRVDLMLNAMCLSALEHGEVRVKNADIARPILFIDDLVAAILRIHSQPVSGIFNLASVNLTVEEAARVVIASTGAARVQLPDDPRPYNFHLDVSKFATAFGEFRRATIEETVAELLKGLPDVERSVRDRPGPGSLSGLRADGPH